MVTQLRFQSSLLGFLRFLIKTQSCIRSQGLTDFISHFLFCVFLDLQILTIPREN